MIKQTKQIAISSQRPYQLWFYADKESAKWFTQYGTVSPYPTTPNLYHFTLDQRWEMPTILEHVDLVNSDYIEQNLADEGDA